MICLHKIQLWKDSGTLQRSRVRVVLDIDRELCFNSVRDSGHRGANLQQLSWVPYAEVIPKRLRRNVRPNCSTCSNSHFATFRRSGGGCRGRAVTGRPVVPMWCVISCRIGRAVRETDLSKEWKLGQQFIVGGTSVLGSYRVAGRGVICDDSLDAQLRSGIWELFSFHIHKEIEMSKEISSKDWSLHVRDNKNPGIRSMEA